MTGLWYSTDACLERLTEELNLVVAESTQRSQEIEVLSKAHAEGQNL